MKVDRKDDYLFVRWASEVKRRDRYTCQICGRRGVVLNAHHIKSWVDNPDDRYDIENGVTLCQDDHERFHEIYGKGGNNHKQFNEFKKVSEEIFSQAIKHNDIEVHTDRVVAFLDGYDLIDRILEDLKNES